MKLMKLRSQKIQYKNKEYLIKNKVKIILLLCFLSPFLTACLGNPGNEDDVLSNCTYWFKNYDGTTLQTATVPSGTVVDYTGPKPTRPSDGFKNYEFSGWGYNMPYTLYKDKVFNAKYNIVPNTEHPEYTNASFKYEQVSNGYEITKMYEWERSLIDVYEKYHTLYIPSTYNGLPVVGINFGTKGISSTVKNEISKLVLGNNIRYITDYSFKECSSLYNIEFNDKLEKIGQEAFYEISQGKANLILNFPNSLKYIGDGAFKDHGVYIGSSQDDFHMHDVDVFIPSSVEYVGSKAFQSSSARSSSVIRCEASSKPNGWKSDWHVRYPDYDRPLGTYFYYNVIWGY